MAGILDFLQSPSSSYGILNGASAMPNPGEGDINVLDNPYDAVTKRAQDEAAKRAAAAALTVFDKGAAPVPAAGISGQQAMAVSPFGSLAPIMAPPAPLAVPAPSIAPPVTAGETPSPLIAPSPVPLPRPRPAVATSVDDATLPANAMPTAGQTQSAAPQPAVPETSLLGRIGAGLQQADNNIGAHTSTLLALAGGLAGAPSWGTGIGRGLTAAAAALPVDQKLALQQGGIRETYKALVAANVPPQLALASVYNPTLLASTVQNYITDRKREVKTLKDASGNERLVSVDPYDATQPVKDLTPQGSGSTGFLAPGVPQEDKTLTGDAYMAQYSPELQSMAKAYMNGDIMPTGNPRQQGLQPKAKEIAIKYGMDTGTPVSDSTYAEKRHMKSDLGASGNSSMGGILSNGQSSFSHLAELGESMSDLGNVSHDFWGGGPVASAQNYVGNAIAPSSAIKAKIKAINDNLGHYGQESTKFYSGTGGGEAERMNALKEMNPASTSSEEMASYLEKEKSLMLDRMNTKFAQIHQTLGPQEGDIEIQKKVPDLQKTIARIDASIARLRGGQAPATGSGVPPSQAGAPKPGNYVWTPDSGLSAQP